MSVEISKKWHDNLIKKRALVREALQGHRIDDFLIYFLKKEDLLAIISQSDRTRCYECNERIEEGEGIELLTVEKEILKLTEKEFELISRTYFHKYHF